MGKRILPLADFLPEFFLALEHQLGEDQKRYGNTWIISGRDGQEARIYQWMTANYRAFVEEGMPFPWLKMAGEALIGWVRQNYWGSIMKWMEKYGNDDEEIEFSI